MITRNQFIGLIKEASMHKQAISAKLVRDVLMKATNTGKLPLHKMQQASRIGYGSLLRSVPYFNRPSKNFKKELNLIINGSPEEAGKLLIRDSKDVVKQFGLSDSDFIKLVQDNVRRGTRLPETYGNYQESIDLLRTPLRRLGIL